MAPGKPNEPNHDNASDETSTSAEYKSPFEPQSDMFSNKSIAEINRRTTIINERVEPEFFRDVCPYFAPTLCNLGVMLIMILMGKPFLGAWLMFIGTPLYNYFLYHDN